MALLWLDGFEDLSLMTRKYGVYDANGALVTTTSRPNSGNALLLESDLGLANSIQLTLPAAERGTEIIVGAALYCVGINSSGASTNPILRFYNDAGNTIMWVDIDATGVISARRLGGSGAICATAAGAVIAAQWFYFEIRYLCDQTVGEVEMRVNGITVASATGADTNGSTGNTITTIHWSGHDAASGAADVYIDDFYVCDPSGTDYNTFLGDIRVETIRPNGNGNANQFTGSDGNSTDNYLLVDEAAYSSADYVGSDTAGHNDQYTFGNLARTTGSVRGVMALGVVSKDDSGAKDAHLLTRTGGVDYNGDDFSPTTSDSVYKQVWEVNPGTTADWSISEVNAAEFGIEVV